MIEAQGLHKYFGTTHALRGLDLSATEGTVLGVLGPNGAGKKQRLRSHRHHARLAGLVRRSAADDPGGRRRPQPDLTLEGTGGPAFWSAVAWSVGILAVCFPLGLWLYARRTTQ